MALTLTFLETLGEAERSKKMGKKERRRVSFYVKKKRDMLTGWLLTQCWNRC